MNGKKKFLIPLAILIVSLLGLSYLWVSHNNLTNQMLDYQKDAVVGLPGDANEKGNYSYDANAAVTNYDQLMAYRNAPGDLTLRGYVALPTQAGVTNPIYRMPIYEGVSDKTLAYGAGTSKPGEAFGEGNFAISAHNFADNKTFFSPLQTLDASKSPVVYLYDGTNIYTYLLVDKKVVNLSQGEVLNNDSEGLAEVTLVTCDEPNLFLNLHPDNRIVVSGVLQSKDSFDESHKNIQNLFSNN